MAPPQHQIWGLYEITAPRVKGEKAHPDAKCLACQVVLKNAQPSRNMIKHVISCPRIDDQSKGQWRELDAQRRHKQASRLVTPAKSPRASRNSTPSVTKRLFKTPQRRRSSEHAAAANERKSAKGTQEDNNLRVALGLIATGIPFRVVENPHFKAMFDYDLPSRRQISGRLLDKLYKREKKRVIGFFPKELYQTWLLLPMAGRIRTEMELSTLFLLTLEHPRFSGNRSTLKQKCIPLSILRVRFGLQSWSLRQKSARGKLLLL